jgi:Ni/Fe-hydrogenase subunit HybB-like protein
MKKYKPIVRPAILTAFLGYLLAVIAIFFDVGHPFRLWHPAVMWQINSVMWIVALHVILYTTTLALEFSPMVFERLGWNRAKGLVERFIVPVVLFGVMLSVLHQSSLGAVFLISSGKLSDLWYTSLMPYLFLVSAVMMGLSMVSLECIVSAKAFKHRPPLEILTGLARGSLYAMTLYLALKLVALLGGPGVGAAFDGSFTANLYLLEMVGGLLLPLGYLVLSHKARTTLRGMLTVNILVIGGVLLNRMNVCIFGTYEANSAAGYQYFPSGPEVLLSIGLIALGVFLFKMTAKYLDLFPESPARGAGRRPRGAGTV